MSTIKSSDEHLTLNADGSSKDIKFQANGVEKASISSSGAFTSTTIDATKLTGDVPDASFPSTLPAASAANLTAIPAANITGTLPAISGASLTGLTSTQMPSGSIVQFASDFDGDYIDLRSTTAWVDTALSISFTPKFSDSIIAVQAIVNVYNAGGGSTHGSVELQINKNGSTFGQNMILYSGYGGTEALVVGPFPVYYAQAQGNTNAETYKVQVKNDNTGSGASHNQYNGYSSLYIWEIKA